ncbi:GSPII_E domain/HD domain/response regulator [Myxococcus stipitatus DSM 14675]|uniref:GSPII_E domain/HD domain/response regulator n=1 Tax=Myxococcus stipitatus (strain DSM 14675 / JCM 12634 / Mx s8) TaxID=1278073 RepID=L7UIZ4_MYXSD|nr:tetratricopeptide repeat protein [Myxococcus stipitatus]AGC47522.1 GSPII_E domain/HD domain/response regulator [Myxococcus stipitatus DSM 14675]
MGEDDFQCEHCGLLLDPEQASGEYTITEPTIVRALLSPPQRTRTMEVPRPPPQAPAAHHQATARFTVPMDENTVPHLRAGLNIALQPLHPFEAHIASFVDGVQAVPQLARAARLPEIEVKVVLKGLLERGVLELHRQPVSAPPRSLTSEMPVLDGGEFLAQEELDGPEAPTLRDTALPSLSWSSPAMGVALGAEEDFSSLALGDDEPVAPVSPPRPPEPTRAARPLARTSSATDLPPPLPPRDTPSAEAMSRRVSSAPPSPSTPPAPIPAARVPPPSLVGATRSVPPPSKDRPESTAQASASAAAPAESRAHPSNVTASSAPTLPASPLPASAPRAPRATLPLDAPVPIATNSPEDILQRAVRLERSGHVDRAIQVLSKAIDQSPDAAVLLSKLALILVHQRKDYAQAARLLERAVELEPGNTVFQQNLLKVAALSAAASGQHKARKPGLLARLTGKRS